MSTSYQPTSTLSTDILSDQIRRVVIPVCVMSEIESSELGDLERLVIYRIIYATYATAAHCQRINQRVLSLALSSYKRDRIIDFIRQSEYLRAASSGSYQRGKRSMAYEVVGIDLIDESPANDQHHNNGVPGTGGGTGGGGCGDGVESDWYSPWSIKTEIVYRSVDFAPLLARLREAWDALGYSQAQWDAEWSLRQVGETDISEETIFEIAKKRVEEGLDRPAEDSEVLPVAEVYAATVDRFAMRRTDGLHRKDGRVYSSATSLQRDIRGAIVRYEGEAETLDLSAAYPWLLAAEHRQSRIRAGLATSEVDAFMEIIESGRLYESLADIAGLPYGTDAERATIKQDFQRFCLFGAIGWHPLWRALQSICPGICRDVRWWRSQRGGATRLAHVLMRAEGQLMTDGVVRWLVSSGIPAVQIHDGAIVPRGAGQVAADWLADHSRRIYGRSCRVKVVA